MVSLSRDLSEIGEQVIVLPFLQDHKLVLGRSSSA